jgi:hypothetical protein
VRQRLPPTISYFNSAAPLVYNLRDQKAAVARDVNVTDFKNGIDACLKGEPGLYADCVY